MKVRTRIAGPVLRRAIVLLAQHIYKNGGGFLAQTSDWRARLKAGTATVDQWVAFEPGTNADMIHASDSQCVKEYTEVDNNAFITALFGETQDPKWTVELNSEVNAVVRRGGVTIPDYITGTIPASVILEIGRAIDRVKNPQVGTSIYAVFATDQEAKLAVAYALKLFPSIGDGFFSSASRDLFRQPGYKVQKVVQFGSPTSGHKSMYHCSLAAHVERGYDPVSTEVFISTMENIAAGTPPTQAEQKVNINGSYTAVITATDVVVGCQTFTHEAARALVEAVQKTCK